MPTMPAEEDGPALEASTLSQPGQAIAAQLTEPVPCLTLLYHPDVGRSGSQALLPELRDGGAADVSRLEPRFCQAGSAEPLADPYLSRRPVRLESAPGGAIDLVRGEYDGDLAVGGAAVRGRCSLDPAKIDRGVVVRLGGRVLLMLHRRTVGEEPADDLGITGPSEAMDSVRQRIRKVADLQIGVLIRGETGTGKELVARAIHDASPRRGGPFVSVNMAAVPTSTAPAALFGHLAGAFTGAAGSRDGYFGAADNGTLFLDEIGETPADVQPMLLRALETAEIQPVGASAPRPVDIRLLAATDADLEAAVGAGRFRAPLLHRLAEFEIELPPLRQRREDIGALVGRFLRDAVAQTGDAKRLDAQRRWPSLWLPTDVVEALLAHDWPGNARQLRNAVTRLAIEGRGADRLALPAGWADDPEAPAEPDHAPPPRKRTRPAEMTNEMLRAALRRNRWSLAAAARDVGISRGSLYTLVRTRGCGGWADDLGADEIREELEIAGYDLDEAAERLEVSRRALRRRMKTLGVGDSKQD